MAYSDYVPVTGTITSISAGNNCCSQMITLFTENGIVNFTVSPESIIIENRQLRQGMRVTAFYDSSLPVPLIYPPLYLAQIVILMDRNDQVMLNYFDRNLLAADRSLQLNISRSTDISTVNGQRFTCSLGDRVLLVTYTVTTRSIPPQTTPDSIIVLC